MKNLLLVFALFIAVAINAQQSLDGFAYQGVARNGSGSVIASQDIGLRISIIEGSPAGTVKYKETHTATTNVYGLFTITVGKGTPVTGTFNGVPFHNGNHYLQVEADMSGGTSYTDLGTTLILAVPYSKFSENTGEIGGRKVSFVAPNDGEYLKWNGNAWVPDSVDGFKLVYTATETNASDLFTINNLGDGSGIVGTNGSTTSNVVGVKGVITSTSPGGFSAGVRGINNGTGGLGVGVYGSQAGSGWGVYGVTPSGLGVYGNSTNSGYGVYGNSNKGIGVSANSVSGIALTAVSQDSTAAIITNINNNNVNDLLYVKTTSKGDIPTSNGAAGHFIVDNTNSIAPAVRAEVNTIFGNFGAAAIWGTSSGTGGYAGLFHASNTSGNGPALIVLTDGNGNAITANAGKNGNAVEANIDGTGKALYAWVPSFSTGRAADFQNYNTSNTSTLVTAKTVGNGNAAEFIVDNSNGTSTAVKGEVNSKFANFGTAGIFGESSGTGGYAGLFYSSNAGGNGPAVLAITEGTGNAITASAGGSGDGVEASTDGTGNAISGFIPNFGTGTAGRFANFNNANSKPIVHGTTTGTGNVFLANHQGPSGNIFVGQTNSSNVARIDRNGKGFFNGGTQNSGADLAEAFDVSGERTAYTPGDVLVISIDADRTVEKSSEPYSSLVAGVYATKPGVLLTEESVDADLSDKVPMGVVGVIPTKVCNENGEIRRGDLLVTSSLTGHAMKADPEKVKLGQVIGKALENFDGTTGMIKVLVNVK